jgi:hypothetical protein
MSDEKQSTLLQFAARPATPEQTARLERPALEKIEYRAAVPFLGNEERYFLTAFMSNGNERDVNYAFFVESLSVAPDRLAFMYTNGVLYIRGENVRKLRPLLKQRLISELHPFDPDRHLEPEEGAPIIHTLDWRYPDEVRSES